MTSACITLVGSSAAVSLAARRMQLLPRWLSVAGLFVAGVFGVGAIFSVLGRTVEGKSSLYGVGLFIIWMLAVSVLLWRASTTAASEADHVTAAP